MQGKQVHRQIREELSLVFGEAVVVTTDVRGWREEGQGQRVFECRGPWGKLWDAEEEAGMAHSCDAGKTIVGLMLCITGRTFWEVANCIPLRVQLRAMRVAVWQGEQLILPGQQQWIAAS
jgi:hypothetical protein